VCVTCCGGITSIHAMSVKPIKFCSTGRSIPDRYTKEIKKQVFMYR
jgi:hypothetical protein